MRPKVEKAENEHPWFEPLEIRWVDAGGVVRYRSGGQAARQGPIWERYLGSALAVGSYTVSVHARSGPLLAQRSFEVLPDDVSTVEPAARLRLLPQYFDLVNESDNADKQGMPAAQSIGTAGAGPTSTSTTTVPPPAPKLSKESQPTATERPSPAKQDVSSLSQKARETRARDSGSAWQPGAKDLEWLQKEPSDSALHMFADPLPNLKVFI